MTTATTRVMIAIPSHETVSVRFASDLARLFAYSSASLLGAVELNIVIGTYIHNARDRLATDALAAGFSHVLWIDADMRFPPDALVRLLAHHRPMVGINYATRAVPARFVAMKHFALGRDEPAEWLVTGPDSTGLEEVEALGFGLVLVWADALHTVRQAATDPVFGYEWIPERREWFGEDFYFCRKARAAGLRIYVDHDLSKECAHIGSTEYRLEHAFDHLLAGAAS